MWPNLQKTAYLVTFTEEILNGKLHLCAVRTEAYGFSFPGDLNIYHISELTSFTYNAEAHKVSHTTAISR